jgi:hypothetical protein
MSSIIACMYMVKLNHVDGLMLGYRFCGIGGTSSLDSLYRGTQLFHSSVIFLFPLKFLPGILGFDYWNVL